MLEAHLQGRRFVVGERMSIADIVAGFTLDWANEQGLLEDHPTLRAYMERLYARPAAPLRLKVAAANIGM